MKKNILILIIIFLFAFAGCIGLGVDDFNEITSPMNFKLTNNSPKDVNVVFSVEFCGYSTTSGGILTANTAKKYDLNLDKFWTENKAINGYESYGATLMVYVDNKYRLSMDIDVEGLGKYRASAGNWDGTITGTTTDGAVTVKWK